jgi:molybdate transport system substrate-binding protein
VSWNRFARTWPMRSGALLAASAAVVALLAGGCKPAGKGADAEAPSAPKVELIVGVAASMRDAFDDAVQEFRQTLPRVKVTPTIGATGALIEQIRAGAPMDLLLSADPKRTASLVAEGMIQSADDVHPLAGNSLVAVVPAASTLFLRDASELVDPGVARIALGNPATVPAGEHAKRAMEAAGVWNEVEDRTVLTDNVRHALDLAIAGEVDVAFVYLTDARSAVDADGAERVRIALTFPLEGTLYDVALLSRGKAKDRYPASAQAFFEFLCGDDFRRILENRGFRVE